MIPIRPRRRPRALVRGAVRAVVAVAAVAAVASACSAPAASFDPAGPCTTDGRAVGAYPDLEAALPRDLGGRAPTSVDSGRNCTAGALGSLVSRGLASVEFAGAVWDLGGGLGVSSVVFSRPDRALLPAAWIAEFYEIGARTAKRTDNIETSRPTIEGAGEAWRLDTLNQLSLQTVVTWQDGDLVRTVLIASVVAPNASRAAHDDLVAQAIAAAVAAPGGPADATPTIGAGPS
ncbi:MAG: hypothetical protein HYX57_04625 [Chloroflexi bacterium]|nr:hypothetical protein [Chloroflexota bacterium]